MNYFIASNKQVFPKVTKVTHKKVSRPVLFYLKIWYSITQCYKGVIKVLYFAVH